MWLSVTRVSHFFTASCSTWRVDRGRERFICTTTQWNLCGEYLGCGIVLWDGRGRSVSLVVHHSPSHTVQVRRNTTNSQQPVHHIGSSISLRVGSTICSDSTNPSICAGFNPNNNLVCNAYFQGYKGFSGELQQKAPRATYKEAFEDHFGSETVAGTDRPFRGVWSYRFLYPSLSSAGAAKYSLETPVDR